MLLVGLIGTMVSQVVFGMAQNYYVALAARFLTGCLNGNVAIAKVYLGEITDSATQASGFGWLSFTWGFGTVTAPAVGGWLADPAGQYPNSIFAQVQFFKSFPYILPALVSVAVSLSALLLGLAFLPETEAWRSSRQARVSSGGFGRAVVATRGGSGGGRGAAADKRQMLQGKRSAAVTISVKNSDLPAVSSGDDCHVELAPLAASGSGGSEHSCLSAAGNPDSGDDGQQRGRRRRSLIVAASTQIDGHPVDHDNAGDADTRIAVLDAGAGVDAGVDRIASNNRGGKRKDTTGVASPVGRQQQRQQQRRQHQRHVPWPNRRHTPGDDGSQPIASGSDDTAARAAAAATGNDDAEADEHELAGLLEGTPSKSKGTGGAAVGGVGGIVRAASSKGGTSALPSSSSQYQYQQHHHQQSLPPMLPPDAGLRDILSDTAVRTSIINYGSLALAQILFDELLPVFAKTEQGQGGLGWSSGDVGSLQVVQGATQIVLNLFLYPRLAARFGLVTCFRYSMLPLVPVLLLFPALGRLTPWPGALWGGMAFGVGCKAFFMSTGFTSVMLLINNSSRGRALGAINGVAQSVASLVRAMGPTCGGALYSASLSFNGLGSYRLHTVYAIMSAIIATTFGLSFLLPYWTNQAPTREQLKGMVAAMDGEGGGGGTRLHDVEQTQGSSSRRDMEGDNHAGGHSDDQHHAADVDGDDCGDVSAAAVDLQRRRDVDRGQPDTDDELDISGDGDQPMVIAGQRGNR